MHLLRLLLRDLRGLLAIQALLLLLTLGLTTSDVGDLRVHLAWLVFVLPAWLLAPSWTGNHSGLAKQYTHAVIGSAALHGCLATLGFLLGLGFQSYFIGFAVILASSLAWCMLALAKSRRPRRSQMDRHEIVLWIAIMVTVVAVYRAPRSNDIMQFSLQQQDMAADRSLQPSSIGMSAFGVDQAMPRWRSHGWHVWACLVADATSLPVIHVLHRWATIPLAFAVIGSLIHMIRSMAGRRTPLWAATFAVFGPVVLWYRDYNAFNYSFRLTNSFCLDKDLCLFLIVPASVYLSIGWLRGARHYAWPLLCLIPAILKFHPMTAVYLVLLLLFVVIGYDKPNCRSIVRIAVPSRKAWLVCFGAVALFLGVVLMGDAQGSHEQITRIIQMDFADSRQGRPLHYWAGQYGAVRNHGLPLDTTAWSDGRLHLKAGVLLNCGLLAASQLALLIWLADVLKSRKFNDLRRWMGFAIVLAMLWSAWLVSPLFLSRYPHYLAGYERMHWFAYTPALIAITRSATIVGDAIARIKPNRSLTWAASLAMAIVLCYSAVCFLSRQPTMLSQIRGVNSLLDYELPSQLARDQTYRADWPNETLAATKPNYLKENDRVLFFDTSGNDQYWLIKRGVFWSEPYAEAYALQLRGDEFLEDRRFFYALLDRIEINDVANWLETKGITLIVDRREGADAFLESLKQKHQLGMENLQPGVWRLAE